MMKKFVSGVFVFALVIGFAFSTYAVTGSSIISNPDTPTTEQFMATITRPQGPLESTLRSNYSIRGLFVDERFKDVKFKVEVYTYNPDSGMYEVGTSFVELEPVVFDELIELKWDENRIRIAVYDYEANELKLGQNLQISDHKVNLLRVNLLRKDENDEFGIRLRRLWKIMPSVDI